MVAAGPARTARWTHQYPRDGISGDRRPRRRVRSEVLRQATAAATGKGRADIDPNLAAAAASIDVDALDQATIDGLLVVAGFKGEGGVGLPDEMAGINALLEASPAPLVEVLLKAVFGEVFTPNRRPPDRP